MELNGLSSNEVYDQSESSDHQLPVAFISSKQVTNIRKKTNRRKIIDQMMSEKAKKLFMKMVQIHNCKYELPAPNTMFIEEPWIIEDLQTLKAELNEVKGKLNNYNLAEWRDHTKRRNLAGHVLKTVRRTINPEFLTQAWCKFYEILSFFPLVPKDCIRINRLKSIHLCEAPGAFVTALNHWLQSHHPSIDWDWTATTLNPNYEGNSTSSMLNDDRFILRTIDHWHFGVDNTGNIISLNNFDSLIESEKKSRDKIMLITADGSIDCFNAAGEQEKLVSHLHYCEAVAALHLLSKHGNFVIKLFTIFEHETVCLMFLLSCCFEKIYIKKPATSKEGNSEVYVFCEDFKGSDYISPYLNILRQNYEKYTDCAMFRKDDIPDDFIIQIVKSGQNFKSMQCATILNNIETFKSSENDNLEIKYIQSNVALQFLKVCSLSVRIFPNIMEIVGNEKLGPFNYEFFENRGYYDSYNDRQMKDNMKPEQLLLTLIEDLKCIDKTNYLVIFQFPDGEPEVLDISTAIPYEKIQSSKFCRAKILKIFHLAYEINNKFLDNRYYPANDAVTKFINTNESNKFVTFHYSLKHDGYNVIKKIYEAIMNLKQNETLVLIGYSLLTQFNIGIIYYLTHIFKYVEFRVINELGCIITMYNYIIIPRVIAYLKSIFETSIVAKNNNEIILSVIPITLLCDSNLYPKILDVNHLTIKYFVDYILTAVYHRKPE